MDEQEIYFVDRTIKHIRRVQDNMILLEKNIDTLPREKFDFFRWELIYRSMTHDLSKFSGLLVDGFIDLNTLHRNNRLGKFTTKLSKVNLYYINEHRKIEKHHAHFRENMSDLDLCEMCCDLSAISQEFNEKDYTTYFKEKLIKQAPLLKKYKKKIIYILELLQKLNNEKNND